jgi:heme A synthase
VALPAAYFASRGLINGPLGRRLGLLFLMGGTQGLVGWWMVRSGFRVSCGLCIWRGGTGWGPGCCTRPAERSMRHSGLS